MICTLSIAGMILTSANGNEWKLYENSSIGTLWYIQFIDDMRGWANGQDNDINFDSNGRALITSIVLRTEDGGETWKKINFNTSFRFIKQIFFLTKNDGWAVGEQRGDDEKMHSIILSTKNGGDSWDVVSFIENSNVVLVNIYFSNENVGWVSGFDYGEVLDEEFGDNLILATNIGGLILYTNDSGKNWTKKYRHEQLLILNTQTLSSINHGPTVEGLRSIDYIAFSDNNHGWAVGDYDDKILHTNDGGKTWRVQKSNLLSLEPDPRQSSNFRQISAIDNNNVWVVGGEGQIYKTTDGGTEWKKVVPGNEYDNTYWTSVKFIDDKHGWIGSLNGVILSTKDGGINWVREVMPYEKTVISAPSEDRIGISDFAITKTKIFVALMDGRIYSKNLNSK